MANESFIKKLKAAVNNASLLKLGEKIIEVKKGTTTIQCNPQTVFDIIEGTFTIGGSPVSESFTIPNSVTSITCTSDNGGKLKVRVFYNIRALYYGVLNLEAKDVNLLNNPYAVEVVGNCSDIKQDKRELLQRFYPSANSTIDSISELASYTQAMYMTLPNVDYNYTMVQLGQAIPNTMRELNFNSDTYVHLTGSVEEMVNQFRTRTNPWTSGSFKFLVFGSDIKITYNGSVVTPGQKTLSWTENSINFQ